MSFSLVGFLYIIITGALCYILPIPEIVKGFLALPGFIIIPYLTGNIFITSNFLNEKSWESKVTNLFFLWMLGLILLIVVATVLGSFSFFNFFYYAIGILIIIGIKFLLDKMYGKKHSFLFNLTCVFDIIKRNYKEVIVVTLITSLPLILLMGLSPFPANLEGDTLRFCLESQQILHYSLIPKEAGYFPFLPIIVAYISILFNIHPYTLFWTGTFISYFVYAFGIYLLGYQISKNKQFSLIMVLFAVFPFYTKTMSLYRFIPQTWIYFIFPWVLLIINKILSDFIKTQEVIKQKQFFMKISIIYLVVLIVSYFLVIKIVPIDGLDSVAKTTHFIFVLLLFIISFSLVFNKANSFMISIVLLGAIFLHHSMGLLVVVLLMTYLCLGYLLNFVNKKNMKYYRMIIFSIVFLLIITICLQVPTLLPLSTPYDMPYYTFGDFSVKADLLTYAFPYLLFSLFVIGIIYISLARHDQFIDMLFLILSLVSLFIYFLPIDVLLRILPMFAVFFIYVSTKGFFWIKCQLSFHKKGIFSFLLIMAIMLPMLFSPILNFINDVRIEGSDNNQLSIFTQEEYDASLWIEKNVPNALIISDPWTQLVIGGLSGSQYFESDVKINKVIKKIIMSSSSEDTYNQTMLILSQKVTFNYSEIKNDDLFTMFIMTSFKGQRFEKNLDLTKKDALLIITPRTIEYGKSPYFWYPSKTKSFLTKDQFPVTNTFLEESNPLISKFYNDNRFELIYHKNGKLYVFKVKHLNK